MFQLKDLELKIQTNLCDQTPKYSIPIFFFFLDGSFKINPPKNDLRGMGGAGRFIWKGRENPAWNEAGKPQNPSWNEAETQNSHLE